MHYAGQIAKKGLEIKAIKLSPDKPFLWASGFYMPIYNDNRMFLFYPESRKLIAQGFKHLLTSKEIQYDIIAGTSTAGISPATTLGDLLEAPVIYVRDKPKSHGLKNQIEGIDAESDLQGKKVILTEDLVSTAGSSVKAVQGIRNANGDCKNCLSIFHYGLDVAEKMFNGEEPYNNQGHKLEHPCQINSLLTYDLLLKVAKETNYINSADLKMLTNWRKEPFAWGEKHGFPRVNK